MSTWNAAKVKVENYFNAKAIQGLEAYMGSQLQGRDIVYTAPFSGDDPIESILKDWDNELQSIAKKWPTLYDFEQEMRAKVGPLSVQKPLKDRLTDVQSYYEDIHLSSEPISSSAIAAVAREWKLARGLTIRNQNKVMYKMKKSTNSGAPDFTKRRKVVEGTLPSIAERRGDTVLLKQPDWKGQTCAVIGWRGQEGGASKEDVKQRVIWMFPFGVNLAELQVYQPLIEAAQTFNLVPAWVSMDAVDRQVTNLFDTKESNDLIVCTDFSRFDQHFNADLQQCAYLLLEKIFNNSIDSWLKQTYWVKYMIPIYLGNGRMYYGQHGMASGSGGTNADETLAHRALQYEAAQKFGSMLNPFSQCLGDDGMLSFKGITADKVREIYTKHGLDMQVDKQTEAEDMCIYLRRWHHAHYRVNGVCVGVYSTMRALGRLRYLERWMDPEVWSTTGVALRQISILENVKFHPLKEQFVDFCMKRDKYRLGIDIPGFLDNIDVYAKEAIDYMPDFLGYTKSQQSEQLGLASWWIVKYLKSKV
nr:RNA-dependent RNA polymerase [Feline picobirnavirus]